MVVKVALNDEEFGRFGVSQEGMRYMVDRGYQPFGEPVAPYILASYLERGLTLMERAPPQPEFLHFDVGNDVEERTDTLLIEMIETLGAERASGAFAKIRIAEVPDDVRDWDLVNVDGKEWIAEAHRTW